MAPNRRAKQENQPNQGGQQHRNGNNHQQQGNNRPMKCVRPTGCLDPDRLIYKENVESGATEVVRVTCNNLHCDQGNFMHSECFTEWEDTVLSFLSSTGRARSWSVKQRLQNLWTKKGYDLAFKACDCRCGKGHLRKDLDWVSPKEKMSRVRNQAPRNEGAAAAAAPAGAGAAANNQGPQQQPQQEIREVAQNNNNQQQGDGGKKKKKSKAKENLPTLSLSAPVPHPNDNHSRKVASNTSGSSSAAGNTDGASSSGTNPWNIVVHSALPDSVLSAMNRPRLNSLSSNASGSSVTYSGGSGSPPSPGALFGSPISTGTIMGNAFKYQQKKNRDRSNSTSGFARRTDFASFNVLPRHKMNAYHIKMEDDGHGNDDMRPHILAALLSVRATKVNCCLCHGGMVIYDRYPLVDGTFFLSPRQHNKEAIPMTSGCTDRSVKYLNAVCMACLEGTSSILCCRWCRRKWDGSSLVLGGCYNYDVFAATPCCVDRLQCTNCGTMVVPVEKCPNYFSEFSHPLRCDRCGLVDFHLAKPIHMLFDRYTQRLSY